jgi:hypothetical protein
LQDILDAAKPSTPMVNYRKYQKRREYTCVTGPRHNIDVGAQMKQYGEQAGKKKEKKCQMYI